MVIEIKYKNGQMTINLENFFPTSQARSKKLLSIIDMDYDHNIEIIESTYNWLVEEQGRCDVDRREYANKYVDIIPKVKEAEQQVLIMNHKIKRLMDYKLKDEVKQAKEELKKLKAEFTKIKNLKANYNSTFKSNHSRKENLQKNIDLFAQRR